MIYLGTYTACRGMTLASHWRFLDNNRVNTSADVLKFKIRSNYFKCWILLKPVLGGVDGSLLFPLPPWSGSIKPRLQHLQFCYFGLSLGVPFSVSTALWRQRYFRYLPNFLHVLREHLLQYYFENWMLCKWMLLTSRVWDIWFLLS